MQHRAEHFALQFIKIVQFKQHRRHKRALLCALGQRDFMMSPRHAFHFLDVRKQVLLRLGINHRADIGVQQRRIAHTPFIHRAFNHGNHVIGHFFLHTQHAQGRAALAGGIESGIEHIGAHLLGQRGGIDNHRIHAAGFGD